MCGLERPLILLAMGVPPEGYGSISTVKDPQVDTGNIIEEPYQDAHICQSTDKSWRGTPPHDANATLSAAPPGIIPRELPHLQQSGIQNHASHPGGTYWRLQPNDSDGYQDHRPGLLSQHYGICHFFSKGDNDGGQRFTGVIGNDCLGATSGMDHQINALSRSKRGELQGRHRKTDPAHQSIPPPPHPPPHPTLEHLLEFVEAMENLWDQ